MPDDRFGKFRLLKLIASGGMGEVFLAKHEGPQGFSKPVAVKRILTHFARDPAFVQMFLNEARLAALLQHPNIVQIFELGEAQGTYFISMELVVGRTLRSMKARLKERGRAFPPAYAARIASAVLHGLHYAHTLRGAHGEPLGIVHRDMSPDNVMVGLNGSVKVLDFGIAKAKSRASTTATGTVKGKYAYLSPETLDAKQVDGRTDLWSVGVMLYEMLAGVRPFTADDDAPLVKQILLTEPVALSQIARDVPPELSAIVDRALQKDPQGRFATAEEMAVALERVVTGAQVSLGDAETGAFMRELFSEAETVAQVSLTPSGEHATGGLGSGLYLSDPEDAGKTQQKSVVAAGINTPWRALAVGAVAAALLVLLAWALAGLGARRPALASTPRDPIAAMPVEDDPSAPMPEPQAEPAIAAIPAAAVDAGAAAPVATVSAGGTARAAGRGRVDLRVKPWAEVFEGRKSFGVTPMPPLELPAGKHTLTLKNSDLSISRAVIVKVARDATVTVRVDLRK